MIEVVPTCKSPPCPGTEGAGKSFRAERDADRVFETVLEKKRRAAAQRLAGQDAARDAARETGAETAAAMVVQPQVETPPAVEQSEGEGTQTGEEETQFADGCPSGAVDPAVAALLAGAGAVTPTGDSPEDCPAPTEPTAAAAAGVTTLAEGVVEGAENAVLGVTVQGTAEEGQEAFGALFKAQAATGNGEVVKGAPASGPLTAGAALDAAGAGVAGSAAQTFEATMPQSARKAGIPETEPPAPAPAHELAPKNASSAESAAQAQAASNAQASRTDPALAAASQPARSAEVNHDLLQQVTRNIQVIAGENGTSMRVHLHPHELGSIDIRLVSNQNGVGIMVLAEKAATSRLLESQLGQLQQAVNNLGLQVSQLWVGQNNQPDSQASLFAQDRQGHSQARNGNPTGGQKDGSHGAAEQPRNASRYTLIDYRV